VFENPDMLQQGGDLFLAQHHRQFLGDLPTHKAMVAPGHFERHRVEKLDGRYKGVDAGGRELALFGQKQLVVADIVQSELFRAGVEVTGEVGYIMDVAPLRASGEVPKPHVFDHAAAKRAQIGHLDTPV